MPSLEQSVDFEVFCRECKSGICSNYEYRSSHNRGAHQFTAEPCDKCLENAREEGYDKGYADAKKEFECYLEHKE